MTHCSKRRVQFIGKVSIELDAHWSVWRSACCLVLRPWQNNLWVFCWNFFRKILNICYWKTTYSNLFTFTAFVSDAYRYLYVNFQSHWISLRVIENFHYLINVGMFGSYELIGTQCFRKFEKVLDQLDCGGRKESIRYHSHGFVHSFTIVCT